MTLEELYRAKDQCVAKLRAYNVYANDKGIRVPYQDKFATPEYVALIKKSESEAASSSCAITIAYGFSAASFGTNRAANYSENKMSDDDLEEEQEVSIPFYVAVFHKDSLNGGQYEIVGLSDRLVITSKSKAPKYVRYEPRFHFLGSTESFYCALVFSPGVHSKELHFQAKTYIKLEKPFDPTVPEMSFADGTMTDDTGFSFDKNINIDFLVKWGAQK